MNTQTNFTNYSITPTFGARNPKAVLERAKSLKNLYGNLGINYKLPNETLSNKEIKINISKIGQIIDKIKPRELKKIETIQNLINENLPKCNGKIIIKDFSELLKNMKNNGADKKYINFIKKSIDALTHRFDKNEDIFIYIKPKKNKEKLKVDLLHELMHSYNKLFKNTIASDNYKLEKVGKKLSTNIIFKNFESKTRELKEIIPPHTNNYYQTIFDMAYKEIPQTEKIHDVLNQIKHLAQEESFAYGTSVKTKYYKEFYEEMAKFFGQKVKELKVAK